MLQYAAVVFQSALIRLIAQDINHEPLHQRVPTQKSDSIAQLGRTAFSVADCGSLIERASDSKPFFGNWWP